MRLSHQPGKKPIPILVGDANVMASRFVCAELEKRSEFDLVGCAAKRLKINGGSVSESNRPEPGLTRLTPVLKTGMITGPHALPRRKPEARFYRRLRVKPSILRAG